MSLRLSAGVWLAASALLVGWLFVEPIVRDGRRAHLLPGATSAGHAQIEEKCELCHTPFSGVLQDACTRCHAADLAGDRDSHGAKKFVDPRNADRLSQLDATRCITCHREHDPARTRAMAVTAAADFCGRCHADVAEERSSHRGMAFESCTNAGCHNFHDNQALNEDFLKRNVDQPELLANAHLPARAPHLDAHQRDGVGCADCHGAAAPRDAAWTARPSAKICATCHEAEVGGFFAGRHGMRPAQELSPMRPDAAGLPMRADASHRELGCTSCHGAHSFDTASAAVEACLGCHADEHTLAYKASGHYRLWIDERTGKGPPGSGVSCATCHLPRTLAAGGAVRVQHNQNDNLRPSSKMARDVCMSCHGLELALTSLADDVLVSRNFDGPPRAPHETFKMIRERMKRRNK